MVSTSGFPSLSPRTVKPSLLQCIETGGNPPLSGHRECVSLPRSPVDLIQSWVLPAFPCNLESFSLESLVRFGSCCLEWCLFRDLNRLARAGHLAARNRRESRKTQSPTDQRLATPFQRNRPFRKVPRSSSAALDASRVFRLMGNTWIIPAQTSTWASPPAARNCWT